MLHIKLQTNEQQHVWQLKWQVWLWVYLVLWEGPTHAAVGKVWTHLSCAAMTPAHWVSAVGVRSLSTKGGGGGCRGGIVRHTVQLFSSPQPWSTHTALCGSFPFSCSPSLVRWDEIIFKFIAGIEVSTLCIFLIMVSVFQGHSFLEAVLMTGFFFFAFFFP